jgi:diamine N-acetyltransferase
MSHTARKETSTPASLNIRSASPDDAPVIQSLARRIWPVCFASVIEPHMIANMLERIYGIESLHEQMREGQRFWIAYCDRQPVGYVSAYTEEDWIWLKKLYCDPAFQGKGIGAAMYNTAVSAFPHRREVRLLVNNGNVAAQAWYERNGFRRIGELPVMMGDFPFTDYLYSKALNAL